MPDSFEVAAYPKVDAEGEPAGEGRLLKRTLERIVADGKTVAWDAVFFVNRPDRDYYLISEGALARPRGLRNRPVRFLELPRRDPGRIDAREMPEGVQGRALHTEHF